jgi:hypothetical protein
MFCQKKSLQPTPCCVWCEPKSPFPRKRENGIKAKRKQGQKRKEAKLLTKRPKSLKRDYLIFNQLIMARSKKQETVVVEEETTPTA